MTGHGFSRGYGWMWVALLGIGFWLCQPVIAQQEPPGPPTTFGVQIDPDRALRADTLRVDQRLHQQRLRALRQQHEQGQADYVYVSLPRLLEQARAAIEAGEALPRDVRYLGGMVKLEYVFIDDERNDLILAGPAEPIDDANPLAAIGRNTGRPVLQFDDLVAAIRLTSGGANTIFGCSIDPPHDGLERMQRTVQQFPAGMSRQQRMDRLVEELGPQQVRFIGMKGDTRLAMVTVAADYRMKRLGLGLDRSPVAAVQHTFSRVEPRFNAWWFTLSDETLLHVSEDGKAYQFVGCPLRIVSAGDIRRDAEAEASPSARRFADAMTEHYEQLAVTFQSFADLWNVTDLSILAALIRAERLDRRLNFDLAWFRSEQGYPLPRLPVPETAQSLVNFRSGSYAIGGVQVRPYDAVSEDRRGKIETADTPQPQPAPADDALRWGNDVSGL